MASRSSSASPTRARHETPRNRAPRRSPISATIAGIRDATSLPLLWIGPGAPSEADAVTIRPGDEPRACAPRIRGRRARRGGAGARARAARPGDLPAHGDGHRRRRRPARRRARAAAGRAGRQARDRPGRRRAAGTRCSLSSGRGSMPCSSPPATSAASSATSRSTSSRRATMALCERAPHVLPAPGAVRAARLGVLGRREAGRRRTGCGAEGPLSRPHGLAEAREPGQGARLLPRLAAGSTRREAPRAVEQHQLRLGRPQLPRELRLAGDRRRRGRR